MAPESKYDKYKLSDYEMYVFKQSFGGKTCFCPSCGTMISPKFLRKKADDGIIHAECLLCFSRKYEEEHDGSEKRK